MMSLLSNGNQGFGKILTKKAVQQEANNKDSINDDHASKTLRISYLPDDCLNLILQCLETRDRNSFGLTCRQWLHIQNNNQEFLTLHGRKKDARTSLDEICPMVVCKFLTRFQHLKYLSLSRSPKVTDFVTSKLPLLESKVEYLWVDFCPDYSDIELSILFSWFPRLTYISLQRCYITDKGLETLTRCCSSLKKVQLWGCQLITDSGIRFLLQNCRQLHSLRLGFCPKITGIGFPDCPKTLTHLEASECFIKPEGIKAIVSGGGIEHLCLLAPYEASINTEALVTISKGCPLLKELILANCKNVKLEGWESIARNCKNLESLDVRRCIDIFGGSINTEVVVTISKGCPLLKELILTNCEEVKLEGWEAIGRNCKKLEILSVRKCKKLCDLGLEALCNGCNKLSKLSIDATFCSSASIEFFKREKPQCHISFHSR